MCQIIEKVVEILKINQPNPNQRIDYHLTLKGWDVVEKRKAPGPPENPDNKPV